MVCIELRERIRATAGRRCGARRRVQAAWGAVRWRGARWRGARRREAWARPSALRAKGKRPSCGRNTRAFLHKYLMEAQS